MLGIFVAEEGLALRYFPIDAESRVEDTDAGVGFGVVELVALVLEDGRRAEYGEAVGKPFVDEELEVVVLTEFDSHVLSERG